MVQRWVGAGLLDGPDEVSWEIDTATCATGATPEVIWQAEDTARWLLWRATGRRFAPEHSAAVRYFSPCPERLIQLDQAFAYPIVSIDAIWTTAADGTPVEWPERSWRFDAPGRLVKHNLGDWTGATFPVNDLYLPHDSPGQWWIEATIGEPIPTEVLTAANQLACELIKAVVDPENCALPDNVRSITRQGVTIEFDRSEWSALPLLQQVTRPWPAGYGEGVVEYGFDPAYHRRWAEVQIAPGS